MRSLDTARQTCDRVHPGLRAALDEIPLMEREAVGSPVIDIFRKCDGVGLLIPREFSGAGVDAIDATRVIRGLSSYSPSLGAAAVMHHFTAAMLFALARTSDRLSARQLGLLARVVPDGMLMASGWAEGTPNQNILRPTAHAHRDGEDWILNGGKKPCSLSRSMDLLTVSVALHDDDEALALALVPAGIPGIDVQPFWGSSILAAAQSDEVRLTDVRVPDDLIVRPRPDDPHCIDDLQAAGFTWFVLLISSVYVGVAGELVARVLDGRRGSATDRASVAVGIESSVALLEGFARAVDGGISGDEAVAGALVARYGVQTAMAEAVDKAVELLGGNAFIRSSEIAYLSSAVRALAFHPPSRSLAAEPLVDYLAGGPLVLG